MKQIADTASPRFHVSPAFAFMDFSPLSASPPLKESTDGGEERRSGGNLKPVLAFVKKVRGVASEIEPKKSKDRSTRHSEASKRTYNPSHKCPTPKKL